MGNFATKYAISSTKQAVRGRRVVLTTKILNITIFSGFLHPNLIFVRVWGV